MKTTNPPTNERLVFKETVVPRRWKGETLKFGIYNMIRSNFHREEITLPFRALALRHASGACISFPS